MKKGKFVGTIVIDDRKKRHKIMIKPLICWEI